MVPEELADYLALNLPAGSPAWVVGTNIFIGSLPETVDKCIMLIPYTGRPIQQVMGGSVAFEHARVQVQCRGGSRSDGSTTGFSDALVTANSVLKVLVAIKNQTIGGTWYLTVQALQSPFFLNRDTNDRPMVACNYEVTKGLS